MIEFGFYETEEDLFHIFNPVILMLDGTTDFESNEDEQAYYKNPEREKEKEKRYQNNK